MEDETAVTHDCIEQFEEFTVWKHDNAPDIESDPFFVAMEWNNIATHVRRCMSCIKPEGMFANLTMLFTTPASLHYPDIKLK